MGISEPKSDGYGGAASSSVVPYWENKKRRSNVWKKREDELLRLAVSEFGDSHWITVANFINQHGYNRRGNECESRWKRSLDPALNKGEWTREETDNLPRTDVDFFSEVIYIDTCTAYRNGFPFLRQFFSSFSPHTASEKKSTSVRGRLAVTTMLSVQP